MSHNSSASSEIDVSKSGILKRSAIEPENRLEKPAPKTKREDKQPKAKTGVIPIIPEEGEDLSAERDDDAALAAK